MNRLTTIIKSNYIRSGLKNIKLEQLRYFQSATTGEKFNYPKETSPFLTIPTQKCTLPYFVRRTKYLSLPVYSEFKNGNTRKLTIVRRIQGDLTQLKTDLLTQFPEWTISISQINSQIVIKGQKCHEVRDWLSNKGF
ncbi:hypothetical protein K502DRAFT_325347 [Neoconidiobolus thromboides FSU 785]|nr:hypothetical protein K502DRAFT_325347 [Neoconidiobolus thromboides FSU 785]